MLFFICTTVSVCETARVAPDANVNSHGWTIVLQKVTLSPKIESLLISCSDKFPPPIHLGTPPLMIHLKRMWQALGSPVRLWKHSSWIMHVPVPTAVPSKCRWENLYQQYLDFLQRMFCDLALYYLYKCGPRLSSFQFQSQTVFWGPEE